MEEDTETLFYLGAGPATAILLGAALMPLREVTTASNLSFAFMALTIVVAEFGGRWAALSTALVSALSLDFFLTQPYLRLSIADKHDIIAFVGLVVCGLIAASLGSQRNRRLAALSRARKHQELLRSLLREWKPADPIEPQVAKMLLGLRAAFPVAAAVVRDASDYVIACSDPADGLRSVPDTVLPPDSLLPNAGPEGERPRRSPALPNEGGRIALTAGDRSLGWLDVWGNGVSAGAESRYALCDVARLLAALLANDGSRMPARGRAGS